MAHVPILIPPLGLEPGDLAELRADVLASSPGATGAVWRYSRDRQILLVGVVHDRKLERWLMQPAADDVEAKRIALAWIEMLSTDSVVTTILALHGAGASLPKH